MMHRLVAMTMTAAETTSAEPVSSRLRAARPYPGSSGPRRQPAIVPPAGPTWFGSIMGTGIFANLLVSVALPRFGEGSFLADATLTAATVVLVIGWIAFIGLTVGFVGRCVRQFKVFHQSIVHPEQCTAWGMVSMGILSLGSATPVVLDELTNSGAGSHNSAANPIQWLAHAQGLGWSIDLTFWWIGTILGIVTAFGFALVVVRNRWSEPRPVWGLPIVPPMVSATTGASQLSHISTMSLRMTMLIVSVGCFFVALTLGAIIFVVAYEHAWRRSPLPLAASASAWIPLGIVGQSTAAAQAIAHQIDAVITPAGQQWVQAAANLYGQVILACGIPLIAYAAFCIIRGFAGRMPFSPSWWALTFPVGTLCLGSHLLSHGTGWEWMNWVSLGFLVLLTFHWVTASAGTVKALSGKALATA